MPRPHARLVLAALLALPALGPTPAAAKDRPIDRDWQTGVTVAPGAQTWTADNFANKKGLIREIAGQQGKACLDHYAFLGWGAGTPEAVMQATRSGYEKAGYSVEQKPGSLETDTIWQVRNDAREAVVLWGSVEGSTIYLSCLTAGQPAPNPEKPLYLAILSALGLAGLLSGLWLIRRVRGQARAALGWPTAAGTVAASEVASFKTKRGRQFMAQVAYSYEVAGTQHSGNRLRFGHYAGALATAEADAGRYKPGSAVQVRYDPARPEQSVLEAGAAGSNVPGLVLAITGAVFLVVVAIMATVA